MIADLHVHTKYSRDSRNEPALILERAKNLGLDGIAVTDHGTIRGALETKKLNRDRDFSIIVGCEIKTDRGEIGAYNISEEIKSRELNAAIDEIKSQGGLVWVPHPFDVMRKGVIRKDALSEITKRIDLIEGFNARTFGLFNKKAQAFAMENKIPMVAGSDAHMPWEIGKGTTEFRDLKKPESIASRTFPGYWLYPKARTIIYKMINV